MFRKADVRSLERSRYLKDLKRKAEDLKLVVGNGKAENQIVVSFRKSEIRE